jgi:hypothetical protein
VEELSECIGDLYGRTKKLHDDIRLLHCGCECIQDFASIMSEVFGADFSGVDKAKEEISGLIREAARIDMREGMESEAYEMLSEAEGDGMDVGEELQMFFETWPMLHRIHKVIHVCDDLADAVRKTNRLLDPEYTPLMTEVYLLPVSDIFKEDHKLMCYLVDEMAKRSWNVRDIDAFLDEVCNRNTRAKEWLLLHETPRTCTRIKEKIRKSLKIIN